MMRLSHLTVVALCALAAGCPGDDGNDASPPPIVDLIATAGSGPTMIVPSSPVDKSPYQLEWEDFLSVLEGKSQARVTPEDALRAVEIALAALKSAETGKPVRL